MLEELVRIVAERDPDVIEGHNLFRFDLEYLEARARRHRVKLALGRDGSEMSARASRLQIAERSIAYRRYDIYGRSIIDTWILAQHYDIASRELEGFGLKELAQHFHVARRRPRLYRRGARERLLRPSSRGAFRLRARTTCARPRALAGLLSPSYFVQAQIFPYSYQNVVLRGNATRIDALMMRAYLAARHSIPAPAGAERSDGRLHRDSPLRRRAQRAALRRDLAVPVADAALRARAGGRPARRVPENAGRPAQLPRPGQGGGARTRRHRAAQPRSAAADVQNPHQFVLRLSRFLARPLQRFRPGQRRDAPRARADPGRGRRAGGVRRAGDRGRHRRHLFRRAVRRRRRAPPRRAWSSGSAP